MNPNLSINWLEIAFDFLFAGIVAFHLKREIKQSDDHATTIALGSFFIALFAAALANLFYQRLLDVKAWPTDSIFDQVIVTQVGDVFVKVKDPIIGRTVQVQRYNCKGEFKSAFQPNSAGGVFKIAVNSDNTLSIYSVRTDSIETFDLDGKYVQRRELESTQMPFEFLQSGPSVLQVEGCTFVIDPASGRPAVKDRAGIWPLERGDWILEYVLSRRNIWGVSFIGGLFMVFSFLRKSKIKLN